MAEKNAPLFRKATRGYNKDDVNAYIININRTLEDNKKAYEKSYEALSQRKKQDEAEIATLNARLSEIDDLKNEIREKEEQLSLLREECLRKDDAIASLKAAISELESFRDGHMEIDEAERTKAEYYDSLCSKAGEILVIASGTAENILNRANSEAQKIVGDANTQKELMIKNFTETAAAAADDINVYIRNAVEECILKINKSVNAANAFPDEKAAKPKAVFIKSE